MRLTQETKQTQHLAMTAQLRQAIHILQLSASALEEELERAYMENPLLEMEEGAPPLRDEHPNMDWMAHDFHGADDMDTAEDRTARDTWEPAAPVALSLEEALLREVDFCFSDEAKKAIAVFLIGSLDHRGYLTLPPAEAARATGTCVPDVTEVLRVLQSFEPAGIGARDLAECMRLQAERADLYHGLLRAVIERHLPAVAEGRYRAIARAEGASLAAVQAAVDVLRTFSPKPGSAYGAEPPSYIRADVRLALVDGEMQVTVCSEHLPQLRISRLYRNTADLDPETRSYIARRIYAARPSSAPSGSAARPCAAWQRSSYIGRRTSSLPAQRSFIRSAGRPSPRHSGCTNRPSVAPLRISTSICRVASSPSRHFSAVRSARKRIRLSVRSRYGAQSLT